MGIVYNHLQLVHQLPEERTVLELKVRNPFQNRRNMGSQGSRSRKKYLEERKYRSGKMHNVVPF